MQREAVEGPPLDAVAVTILSGATLDALNAALLGIS